MMPALSVIVRVIRKRTAISTNAPSASASPLAIVTDAALASEVAPHLSSRCPLLDPPLVLAAPEPPAPTPSGSLRKS